MDLLYHVCAKQVSQRTMGGGAPWWVFNICISTNFSDTLNVEKSLPLTAASDSMNSVRLGHRMGSSCRSCERRHHDYVVCDFEQPKPYCKRVHVGSSWPCHGMTSQSHNQRRTTFCHPVTGETSPENHEFDLREEEILLAPQQPMSQRPCSMVSETSTAVSGSTAEPRPAAKAPKPAGKVYSFGKRAQSIKRNQSAPVVARGWLHKQDSSGMHLWKRRWFLLSDFCLFYYKDSREEAVLGSIPLPGYWISPTDPEDRVNRKHSFKAVHTGMRAYIQQQEHSGMRTYYFSADTQEDLNGWMKAMNQAAQMESAPTAKRSSEEMDWQLAPDHMDPTKEYSKLENLQTNNNHQRPDDLYFVRKHEDPRMELVEDQYTLVMVNAEGGTSNHVVTNDYYESKAQYLPSKHEDLKPERFEDRYASITANSKGGTSKQFFSNDQHKPKALYLPSKPEDLKPETLEQDCYTSLTKSGPSKHFVSSNHHKPKEPYFSTQQDDLRSEPVEGDRYASLTVNTKSGLSKHFVSSDHHKPKEPYFSTQQDNLRSEPVEGDRYASLTVNTKSGLSKHFVSSDHHKPKEPYFSTQQDDLRSEPVEGDRYASLTVNTKSGLSKHFVSSDHHKPKEPYFSRKPEVPRPQLVEEDCYTFQKLNSKVPTSKQFSSSAAESAFTEFSKEYRSQSAQPQSFERNGTLPSSFSMSASPVKQNGMDKQGFVQRAAPEKQVQRRSNMAQVEQWVKIQKGDTKSAVSDHTLPRQYNHPPHYTERYQTLPKTRQPSASSPPPSRNLPSDYKYAHDRVNHFKMSNQERKATKDGMVWQLYEWQQRQQFKHGSPTGPINMNTLGYTDRNRSKSFLDVPRCISVPPSPSDIPPAAAPPKAYTLRRSHTPAERVTVRPEDLHGGSPPPKSHLDVVKSAAHVDRRSMPMPGYMTHTVSAPSLHGKSVRNAPGVFILALCSFWFSDEEAN
uniref:Pleckstrin homology domain containing A7 n=1 Tax=Leptobrachium leishanense TaxID=445787 RepID=A0A8C5WHH9_9ANUR